MQQSFNDTIDFIRRLYDQPKGTIPLHAPQFTGNEKNYLDQCIESTFVSSVGKFVDSFENEIAAYTGAKRAVACVNGTSALHMALILSGVTPDSEIITQPLTFIATANAISYCNAHPVFIDVDRDTLGLSPEKLETWLKNYTRFDKSIGKPVNKSTGRPITACVPMHTFGHPCRIDDIVNVCEQYRIPVVEDAAESVGSLYKNRHTGTFGEIGILSFNGNKIITTGGGGMLLFNDEELAQKAKHLTTQAKTDQKWEYIHDQVGYNYRMPNINAALGLAQFELLESYLKSKRDIAAAYKEFFSHSPFEYLDEPEHARSNFWLNAILLKDHEEQESVLEYFNEKGISCRPTWKLMNHLEMYKNCQTDDLSNARLFEQRIVNIPSSVIL